MSVQSDELNQKNTVTSRLWQNLKLKMQDARRTKKHKFRSKALFSSGEKIKKAGINQIRVASVSNRQIAFANPDFG